jgi:hypothetical protein
MLYRSKREFLTPLGSSSPSYGNKSTWALPRQPRRLESLVLRVTITMGGTLPTIVNSNNVWVAWGLMALVKNIQVKASDKAGTDRSVVNLSGASLISYCSNVGLMPSRSSQFALSTIAQGTSSNFFATSTAYNLFIRIPIRHPEIAEPFGNLTCLPLNPEHINSDARVEVEFEASANLWSANAATLTSASVLATYREIPVGTEYIPGTLDSETIAPSTTAAIYEFPTVGVLTGFGLASYTTASYARVNPLASGGTYRLLYGSNDIAVVDDPSLEEINDASRLSYPNANAYTTLADLVRCQPRNEVFFDFISDDWGSDSFSGNSMLNLDATNPALGGDRVRLQFQTYVATTASTIITRHRFLPQSAGDMRALSALVA